MNMTLLETRKQYDKTQTEVANLLGVPVRTYIRYEKDDDYGNSLKRKSMIDLINNKYEITEDKGLLTIESIKNKLTNLFTNHYNGEVEFCYLFGSYAKGYETEKSDVDLCISSSLKGLDFVDLNEKIRNTLHKKVDLIRLDTISDNLELINEIMKDGIKIYG